MTSRRRSGDETRRDSAISDALIIDPEAIRRDDAPASEGPGTTAHSTGARRADGLMKEKKGRVRAMMLWCCRSSAQRPRPLAANLGSTGGARQQHLGSKRSSAPARKWTCVPPLKETSSSIVRLAHSVFFSHECCRAALPTGGTVELCTPARAAAPQRRACRRAGRSLPCAPLCHAGVGANATQPNDERARACGAPHRPLPSAPGAVRAIRRRPTHHATPSHMQIASTCSTPPDHRAFTNRLQKGTPTCALQAANRGRAR